jgi:hypothetical protein
MISTLGGSHSPPSSHMEMDDPADLFEIAVFVGYCVIRPVSPTIVPAWSLYA